MGQYNDECYPVLAGCCFVLAGTALMSFGMMSLLSVNPIGLTALAFGTLCLSFGVFLIRTVCHFNVYAVEMSAEREFEIELEMTVVSCQPLPIARIPNWNSMEL